MCLLNTPPAAGWRRHPRRGIESRWPLYTYKKWAWVVFVVLLGGFPVALEAQEDFEHMQATVESHTQTLMNMGRYLRQTDKFWKWYQLNHRALDDLLAGGANTRALDPASSESFLLQLQSKIENLEVEMRSVREELVEEREARHQLDTELSYQIKNTNTIQTQLLKQQQMLQECQASVTRVEDQVGQDHTSNILMFVKNLAAEANRSLDELHVEVQELRDAQLQPMSEQLHFFNETIESQKGEIRQLKSASRRHSGQLRKAESERRRQNDEMKEDVDQTKGLMAEVQVEVKKMNAHLSTFRQDMADEVDASHNDVINKLKELALDTIFPLQDEVEIIARNLSLVRDSVEVEVEQRLQSLEDQIRLINSRVSNQKTNSSNSQITRLQTLVGRLQGDVSNLRPLRDRLTNLNQTVNDLKAKDDGFTDQIDGFRFRIQKLEDQSGKMNLNHVTLEKKLVDRVTKLESRMKQRNVVRVQGDEVLRRSSTSSPEDFINSLPGVYESVDSGQNHPRFTPSRRIPGNEGSRGYPGDAGSRGVPGSSGDAGSRGLPGIPGNAGSRGASGSPGDAGSRGVPGIPGNAGSRGVSGYPGYAGSRGVPGVPGSPGDAGSRGVAGSSGNAGSRGVAGSPGDAGSRGLPGIPGNAGSRGALGSPGDAGSRGAPGIPGNAGSRGVSGSPGDAGSWGVPGIPGNPGSRGVSGYPGDAGSWGVSGYPGDAGSRGAPGIPGNAGYRGVSGSPGNAGSRGYPGPRGPPGLPGPAG